MMRGYGQVEIPEIPVGLKPSLPGYVTTEECTVQVGALQKKWDDHVPVMIAGGIAAVIAGVFIGRAMR